MALSDPLYQFPVFQIRPYIDSEFHSDEMRTESCMNPSPSSIKRKRRCRKETTHSSRRYITSTVNPINKRFKKTIYLLGTRMPRTKSLKTKYEPHFPNQQNYIQAANSNKFFRGSTLLDVNLITQ